MKNLTPLASLVLLCILSCQTNPPTTTETDMALTYPETKKVEQVDTYFGTDVADPYRWLEVDTAAEVEDWVVAQNQVTQDYIGQIPFRGKVRDRLEELYNYTKVSAPMKVGEYYLFYQNDGLQNQAVLYRKKGLDGEASVFLDPNKASTDGTVSMGIAGMSKDDKYLAISISEAGSDWQSFKVMEVATGKTLDDELKWLKFSGASWYKDGFYYSRYPEPAEGTELSGDLQTQSIYYHKIGTPQSEDKLIFTDPENARMICSAAVTEDEEYVLLYKRLGSSSENEIWYRPATSEADFQPLFTGFDAQYFVVDHWDGKFFVRTNKEAPRYRLATIPTQDPKASLTDLIPEKDAVLNGISKGGGRFFANYMQDATTRIYQHLYDGTLEREIELPGLGSAGIRSGKREDTKFFYTYTSYVYPTTIYQYDLETGESMQHAQPKLNFNPSDYTTEQVFFSSKDGTQVPMFLVYKKGLQKDGQRPTYLTSYGGFNISLTPNFNPLGILLLENGGIFAQPNLRGGGEYGQEWHEGGMLLKKQNVFDDFIAAAEYLIAENYTSSEHLAIAGGSNGGLLVGAVANQRPELFKVAFPAVGVMDMLRYHKFTIGWAWASEYGSSDQDEATFQNLLGYSPIHNLKEGVTYPSIMVTTGDHDDRVVPAHSFKYAATLQEKHAGENPVLIRIEVDAGHGAGKPTSKILDEQADKWSFFFHEIGGVEIQ
ncbi:MAG: prolyl oligopeptidase family serine peptidase [Bacteroidota bacterium]